MNIKTPLFFAFALCGASAYATDYDLVIENMPAGFSVQIAEQNFTTNTPDDKPIALKAEGLNRSKIHATSRGGWYATVSVDDFNRQVAVVYQQMFEPASDPTAPGAKDYCIYESGNAVYLKYMDPNLMSNGFTGDRFIFVEDGTTGKYFIYNKSAGHYITYTQTTDNGKNTKLTSESVVQTVATKAQAKSWKIVPDEADDEFVDFVPGAVDKVTATTDGWNFRGGKDCALNLYRRNDSNSKWIIAGSGPSAALNSATKVFALPGNPFMHKLVTYEGNTVTSVTGLPEGLELDLTSRRYAFVKGTAPEAGQYTYTVHLNEGTDEAKDVEVGFTVSPDLNQPVPFMGLLTWNSFEKHIDQNKVMKLADALVDFGLYDAGFDHMCIDDCWAKRDREGGRYALNPDKFYDLNALCDYVHSKGMKIGIYSDAADRTCSSAMPGSYGYEDVDAADFVKWGFDLLKYDYCFAPADAKTAEKRYKAMYDALAKHMIKAGKKPEDFMLYMCEWGRRSPWIWGANTGATCWRATDDTREHWTDATYHGGITDIIGVMKNIWQYNGPNRFNDADMLMVGLHGTGYSSNAGGTAGIPAGFSLEEQRTNYALWCMWSSPLTLSCNITNMDGKPNDLTGKTVTNQYYKQDLELILNRHLIALDQDPLGQAAEPIVDDPNYIIFAKDLADGDVAISFTNLGNTVRSIKLDLSLVPGLETGRTYEVLDLFRDAKKVKEVKSDEIFTRMSIKKHDTVVFRLHAIDDNSEGIGAISNSNGRRHQAYDLQGRPATSHSRIVIADTKKVI